MGSASHADQADLAQAFRAERGDHLVVLGHEDHPDVVDTHLRNVKRIAPFRAPPKEL